MSRAYRYYDSPDGQDLFLKMEYVWRKVGMFSTGLAALDVFHITMPKTYWGMIERYFRVWTPPMAAATVFTTTVYIATKLRKKDDPWNHVLGGVAALSLINRYARNGVLVWTMSVPVLISLFAYKDLKLKGYNFFTDDTDANYNMGADVIEYDVQNRKSIYSDRNGWIRSDIMN